jgi:hypothetical protein
VHKPILPVWGDGFGPFLFGYSSWRLESLPTRETVLLGLEMGMLPFSNGI